MNIKILGAIQLEKIRDEINKDLDLYKRGIKFEMFRALTILEAEIKQNIRSRSGLKVRTGGLLNSILKEVRDEGNTVVGEIGPYNIPYARVHEEGHTFPARFIEPRFKKALAWAGAGGQTYFSKGHMLPPITIRARPYLRPALDKRVEEIEEKFSMFLAASFTLGD